MMISIGLEICSVIDLKLFQAECLYQDAVIWTFQ